MNIDKKWEEILKNRSNDLNRKLMNAENEEDTNEIFDKKWEQVLKNRKQIKPDVEETA
jgi:hypothetical protein